MRIIEKTEHMARAASAKMKNKNYLGFHQDPPKLLV